MDTTTLEIKCLTYLPAKILTNIDTWERFPPTIPPPPFVTTFQILPLRAKSHASRRQIPGHHRTMDIYARARGSEAWIDWPSEKFPTALPIR